MRYLLVVLICVLSSAAFGQGLTIDHTCTDLDRIPGHWIEQAQSNLHVAYQHTSHGSQLVTGMNALESYPAFGSKYAWSDSGGPDALDFDDYGIPGTVPDLSQGDYIDGNGVTPWVTQTRSLLNNSNNYHVNVIMWSWCSINNHDISRYLTNMEVLVSEYSEGGSHSRAAGHPVKFIFMTGHAEGQGLSNFIWNANEQIRAHCRANDRILFDFADIESYDPDGAYYYGLPMWDDLDYAPGRTRNWGYEWCTNNAGSELEQLTTGDGVAEYDGCDSCAHSGGAASESTINCVLKGRAVWWLMARLAGWPGAPTGASAHYTTGTCSMIWNNLCSGAVYRIERTTESLRTANWTNQVGCFTNHGSQYAWSEAAPAASEVIFYRLAGE